jgi:periplasmic protein TonB
MEEDQQKLNDIVFAGRNRAYGAYALRSEYGFTVLKSLGITLGTAVVLALFFLHLSRKEDKIVHEGGQISVPVYMMPAVTEPVEPVAAAAQKPPSSPAPRPSENLVSTVISSTLAEQDERKDPLQGDDYAKGDAKGSEDNRADASGLDTLATESHGAGSTGTVAASEAYTVDRLPEFKGGLPALYRFLAANLRYPPEARGDGIEGTAVIRFVVDSDGSIKDLECLNHPGFGFDEEALRVLKLVPGFETPAFKNGKAVPMYYHLPVKFRLK